MSSDDLRPISYVVLALVGEGGASPYELEEARRRGFRVYWYAAASQIYAEPKRLAALGYLSATKEPGRRGERTVYRLTEQGREALRDFLRTPAVFPRIQHEGSLRLLAGDLISDEEIVASLDGIRAEVQEIARLVDEMDEGAARLPHRERYLRLQHSLARRLLQAHLDWVDEVERELQTPEE